MTLQALYDRVFNYRIVYYYRKWDNNPQTFNTYSDYVYNEV